MPESLWQNARKKQHLWGVEDIGQQEVKQRPKLVKVVLERGSSQQQSICGLELSHNLWKLREHTLLTRDSQSICDDCSQTCCRWKMDATANLWFLILDTVSLINDQVSPVELFEDGPLDNNHLIGGHAHIPLAWKQRVTDKSRLQPEARY